MAEDTKQLSAEELENFFKRLREIVLTGTEAQLREYVDDHYPHLPESLQEEILFSLMQSSINDERAEIRAMESAETRGLAAMEELEKMKTIVEEEIAKNGENALDGEGN